MDKYLKQGSSEMKLKLNKKLEERDPKLKIEEFKRTVTSYLSTFDPTSKPKSNLEYIIKLVWIDFISKDLIENKKEEFFLNKL